MSRGVIARRRSPRYRDGSTERSGNEERDDGAWLRVDDIHVKYEGVRALRGISLHMQRGEFVSIIGPNGAGKTTTLRAISGVRHPDAGEIYFEGRPIDRVPAHLLVGRGIAHVPEGRRLFPDMTTRENLLVGAQRQPRSEARAALNRAFELFPVLGSRSRQRAGALSGGEQQMLAIARALMGKPRLVLLDEPSGGLAPEIVRLVGEKLAEIRSEYGVGIILVEQNARLALRLADRGYLMELGTIGAEGPASALLGDERVQKAYLT